METEVENVRVLSRGRLEIPPREGTSADAIRSSMLGMNYPCCICHSNLYGLTFVATPDGLGVADFATLEEATLESVEKAENNIDPLTALPISFTVALPATPHFLALSPSETLLAVIFGSSLAVFEVARLLEGVHNPVFMSNNVDARHMCWSTVQGEDEEASLVVLTTDRQVHVYNMKGNLVCTHGDIEATSISWAPEGSVLAVGDDEGIVHKLAYTHTDENGGAFTTVGTIPKPDHVGDNFQVHHLNWAEDNLIFAGYKSSDNEEAASCIFEGEDDTAVDTTELVAFFPSETREHAFYTCYLKPWRMFFVGCSLSTDIELLVSDPESSEWQVWKPLEKYTPRLPMDSNDEDTFPVGMSVVLNSTAVIPGDEIDYPFYPCPLVLVTTTDGILLNFALLDTNEVEFPYLVVPTQPPQPALQTTELCAESPRQLSFEVSAAVPTFTFDPAQPPMTFGQNADNVFNDEDE
ncbi:nuclear pore complex protein, partial [Achlya hypogyna]